MRLFHIEQHLQRTKVTCNSNIIAILELITSSLTVSVQYCAKVTECLL